MLVEGTPEGATAWAGVSYSLAEGETAPVLTVVAEQAELVPPTSVIVAFRASVAFREATAGIWENRPLVDVRSSVRGVPDGPGRWVFPVAPLVSGPDLNIVLAPGFTGSTGSTFSMRFARPTLASLKVTPGDPSDAPSTPSPTVPPPDFVPVDTLPTDFPPETTPPSTPAVPDAPALAQQDRRPNDVAIGNPNRSLPSRTVSNDVDAATRVFGALLLLAGLAFAVWSWSAPAPTMIGLGRFRREAPATADSEEAAEPEPEMGGLGRFAKPRTESPPPLT